MAYQCSTSKDEELECECPRPIQKACRKRNISSSRDVADIIEALDYEAKAKKKKPWEPPKIIKRKKHKLAVCPKVDKNALVPMSPAMDVRLRYISHCANQIENDPQCSRCNPHSRGILGRLDDDRKRQDKRVSYEAECECGIILDMPEPCVTHDVNVKGAASEKSILSVNSPKLSGENIAAQRAAVAPKFARPPLPPEAAHKLIRPHSGIIVNGPNVVEQDFLPAPPMPLTDQRLSAQRKLSKSVCPKKCRKRKQRKHRRHGLPLRRRSRLKYMSDPDDVCGLGDVAHLEHPYVPDILKKGMFETHSLTQFPCKKERTTTLQYGILIGSYNMFDANKFSPKSRGKQALAMSVMAYCLAFHYHPKQWTKKLIDNLVDAGDKWYLQCAEKVHDHSAYMGICEVIPYGKKQVLLLNGKRMKVLLSEPEIVGYTMAKDPAMFNLCRGLRAFFKDHRAGILLTKVLKVVIWKDKICFYIFDPAGRNSKAYSDFGSGCAALINVKDLDAVTELLLGRSIVGDQKFVLAPVKVLKMIPETADDDLQSEPELTLAEKAMLGYKMLTVTTAICNANLHLGDRCFEAARFRQAIPVAVVALTYAKISPPNTWYSKTLDKILRFGNQLYLDCVQPNVLIDLTIDNIPNEISMGPYNCEIIIYRERVKGQMFTTKECVFNVETGFEDFFSHEYNSGILEFNNYALAIWRQKDMFYLFDPYPRTTNGKRSLDVGRACCLMLLNPSAMAAAIRMNWDYLPPTTIFYIHAFKVLKLRKAFEKEHIICMLSEAQLPGRRLEGGDGGGVAFAEAYRERVTGAPLSHAASTAAPLTAAPSTAAPSSAHAPGPAAIPDEEFMGEIVSLMDSIQEDYVPKIPAKYKNMPPEPVEPKIINLDSPTVSVTQVVPPWPKPRDKSDEVPDEDPEYEPTPPPTPPPPPPPEGVEEEAEEEMDEEAIQRKLEEELRRKAEEEEARRKAEELPDPMPPPPPTPQSEPEVPLAPPGSVGGDMEIAENMEDVEPVEVTKKILLTEDAKSRVRQRRMMKNMTAPLYESPSQSTPEAELQKLHNFKDLPDTTQIIRGTTAIATKNDTDYLPFASIMAVVLSYMYTVNTWTKGLVNFVVETAKKLHDNKKKKFQFAPVHVIPKIKIGHQAFHAHVDVVGEGPTWIMEDVLVNKFFPKYDRGMITTTTYSCAIFERNGLYYLYDASTCNAMGLRDAKGHACLLRFKNVHDLAARIIYNKDGCYEDHHFILSRIIVRRLLPETRYKLPEDYDYATGLPKGKKSKMTPLQEKGKGKDAKKDTKEKDKEKEAPGPVAEPMDEPVAGYQMTDGLYRIEGSTALTSKSGSGSHFVCLVAMLLATMHPVRTWDRVMVDTCIEKGLEISAKSPSLETCEKRVIKNLLLDGRMLNVNLKRIIVINENEEKRMEQYIEAVMNRLRFVIIRFPKFSMVINRADGAYHVFDCHPPPVEKQYADRGKGKNKGQACWTLYGDIDGVVSRIKSSGGDSETPEFYTFELTSLRKAPHYATITHKLSPQFRTIPNPNAPFLKRMKKEQPLIDEKMYWLDIEAVPWSRMLSVNSAGFKRYTPKTLWKSWNIEIPGDLYSLFGKVHPTDSMFEEENRGKQYLCACVVALGMVKACTLSAWTGSFLDGIVINGDKYYTKVAAKLGSKENYELKIEDLGSGFDDMYPYSLHAKYEKVIFGFVYNIYPDRFNLSKALSYFFEKHERGILVSPIKNLAFGKHGISYFVFDCQSYGNPIFNPSSGGAYILKCESVNRLIYCMTMALNIRRHGMQFHLYSVNVTVSEKGDKGAAEKTDKNTKSEKNGKNEKNVKSDKKDKK